jgi:hypothetical protein
MKHDLALPPPGAIEPEGKPSKDVKLGQKPVLPPPAKELDEDDLRRAAQKPKSNAPLAERPPPVQASGPIEMRVEPQEQIAPPPREREKMKREKTKSSVSKIKKKKPRAASMMDDEVAVVTRDPRKPRGE